MTEDNNGGYAVLYVDDEEKALKYFSKALAGRFTVFTAGDVEAAEAVLRDKGDQIAVVISDQRMPGKNGVELLKKVRTEYPGMVRLLTTAYSDLNDAIDAINRGEIYRYIQKPWKVESLQAEVVGAMDYFLLRRERDLLLAEKLTARQRMAGIERIAQLVVFSQTFDSLHNSAYALKHFLEQLHTLPGARESDGLSRVDQWELTKWETKRIANFITNTTGDLLEGVSASKQLADLMTAAQVVEMSKKLADESQTKLAIEGGIGADGASSEWTVNRLLLERLVRNVFSLFSQLQTGEPVTFKVDQIDTGNSGERTIVLAFRVEAPSWPCDRHLLSGSALTAVHPVYESVFACMLAAAHHGGHCGLGLSEGYFAMNVSVPQCRDAASPLLPRLGWEWLPEVLSYYEPDIDEFYQEL